MAEDATGALHYIRDVSKPGDANYSPIWRYNDVANTLRSEDDARSSGYPITPSDVYTNRPVL